MLFLLTLSLLSVATVGSVVVYQRGALRRLEGREEELLELPPTKPVPSPAVERTLDTLELGDVIVDGDEDWLIVGTLSYWEEGERWCLHRVDSGPAQRWLEVRRREGWVATWLDEATDVPSFGHLYDGLTHRGRPFRLWRRGDARVHAEGDTGAREAGVVRYTTYDGPGGAVLHVEEMDGQRRALAGERALGRGLALMPGERPFPEDPADAQFRLD